MKISECIGFVGDLLLSHTFERFERALNMVSEEVIGAVRELNRRVHDLAYKRGEHSTILLLPPDRNEVMSRTIAVEPGESQQVRFFPQRALPKGTWVVVLGPATMNGLYVGNMAQSSCSLEEGPAGLTVDDHHLGSAITVGVKGWNR